MRWITNLRKKWTNQKGNQTNDSEWVTVFQSIDDFSIRIQKLKLEDHGIPVVLFDQRDSSYNGAFGHIYLKVKYQDEPRALELINTDNE